MADAKRKGRVKAPPVRYGADHPRSKLDAAQRCEIKLRRANGERVCDLAMEFGVRRTTITSITYNGKA